MQLLLKIIVLLFTGFIYAVVVVVTVGYLLCGDVKSSSFYLMMFAACHSY